MVLLDPLTALAISFILLAAMLYKRVSIGVTLVSTAVIMSFLSMNLTDIVKVFIETTTDPLTISLVAVTFGIMLLSLLYKGTYALESLSKSFGGLLKNPKLIVSTLPAIIGLLPVPGGALMSAPLVEKEAERLGLKNDEETYVNVWFRHIIFPVYPMSQVLILAAALTGASVISIIISQIPVVAVMTVVGYFTVLKKANVENDDAIQEAKLQENLKVFLLSFSPILAMILTVVIFGVDVSIAAFVGIALLLLITRPRRQILVKAISNVAVYKIALAAYGAMLLRSATMASGVSEVIGQTIAVYNVNEVVLLATIPAVLGFLVGSPYVGIAISYPILAGFLNFTSSSAGLLYISAYLGYLGAPTHLCLALTADYFKCSLSKLYKLLLPSLAISFAVALLVYYIL
jgi:integral membrane protein (TIGR00529 family)